MFRKHLINAAEAAFHDGQMTRAQLIRIRFLSLNPKVCEQLEKVVREQIAMETGVTTQEINWDAIADFLVKIWPLIMQLIEMIGGGA